MVNLNDFIKSMGGIVVVGSIIVLGGGLVAYGTKKTVDEYINNKSEQGYKPDVFDTTYSPEKNYGGTRRKKNKSRKK